MDIEDDGKVFPPDRALGDEGLVGNPIHGLPDLGPHSDLNQSHQERDGDDAVPDLWKPTDIKRGGRCSSRPRRHEDQQRDDNERHDHMR